jgi:hypothetical protein
LNPSIFSECDIGGEGISGSVEKCNVVVGNPASLSVLQQFLDLVSLSFQRMDLFETENVI